MILSENIKRIREVMGLFPEEQAVISEQSIESVSEKTKVYTNKAEYEKALKLFNKAKELSDKSKKKFNIFKNTVFKYRVGQPNGEGNYWLRELEKQAAKLYSDNKLMLDDQLTKYENIIKPTKQWEIHWLTKSPSPKVDEDFVNLVRISNPPNWPNHPFPSTKLFWWGKTFGIIYEPKMPKPIYQEPSQPPKPNPPSQVNQPENQSINLQDVVVPDDGERVFGPGGTTIGFIEGKTFVPIDKSEWNGRMFSPLEKQDWDLLNHEGRMKVYIRQKFGGFILFNTSNLNEDMKVDDWGRLHDEESKIIYPYKRISKFVNWFDKEYGDYAQKQGWFIVTSDTEVPKIRYKPEDGNKFNLFFQVQRIDDPMEGEALFGKLKNDHEADELAKKLGLVLDEHGVVIGWDNEIFI